MNTFALIAFATGHIFEKGKKKKNKFFFTHLKTNT